MQCILLFYWTLTVYLVPLGNPPLTQGWSSVQDASKHPHLELSRVEVYIHTPAFGTE